MSVTITPVDLGPYSKTWLVTASANTDVAVQIPHSFYVAYEATAPALVFLTPLQPEFYTKEWTLGVVDENNININSAVTSGGALAGTPQLLVTAQLPNSLME
jgi:hypothetical protein